MTKSKLIVPPERRFSWEQWLAGREERRRIGNLVAPPIIRRPESSSDDRLKAAFDGERGPSFGWKFEDESKAD